MNNLKTLFAIIFLMASAAAHAHKASDSYLRLDVDNKILAWDIALRDLEMAIGLDANNDSNITWGELKTKQPMLFLHVAENLRLSAHGQACDLLPQTLALTQHTDGAYAAMEFGVLCADQTIDAIEYHFLFDQDPTHRGLLSLQGQGISTSAILGPEHARVSWANTTGISSTAGHFIEEGVWHIWIGYDHILFLLALLLPTVVWREQGQWRATENFGRVFRDVVLVVTSFTLAHSITLSLAALEIIVLPSRFIEATIAASVVFAAFALWIPRFDQRRWMMAFAFGLIHGFGFASVLSDLGLPTQNLMVALLSFNVGVELGQLAIVAVLLPIIYSIRQTGFYLRYALPSCTLLIGLFGVMWFVERSFNVTFWS